MRTGGLGEIPNPSSAHGIHPEGRASSARLTVGTAEGSVTELKKEATGKSELCRFSSHHIACPSRSLSRRDESVLVEIPNAVAASESLVSG